MRVILFFFFIRNQKCGVFKIPMLTPRVPGTSLPRYAFY